MDSLLSWRLFKRTDYWLRLRCLSLKRVCWLVQYYKPTIFYYKYEYDDSSSLFHSFLWGRFLWFHTFPSPTILIFACSPSPSCEPDYIGKAWGWWPLRRLVSAFENAFFGLFCTEKESPFFMCSLPEKAVSSAQNAHAVQSFVSFFITITSLELKLGPGSVIVKGEDAGRRWAKLKIHPWHLDHLKLRPRTASEVKPVLHADMPKSQ